jgi:hypothetical protein
MPVRKVSKKSPVSKKNPSPFKNKVEAKTCVDLTSDDGTDLW